MSGRAKAKHLPAARAAVTVAATLGACGGAHNGVSTAPPAAGVSSAPDRPSARSSPPSESTATFCGQVSRVGSDLQTAGSDTQLSDAKRDFAQVVTATKAITNPPSAIRPNTESLISDVEQINTWLDTKAAQADLSGNNIPSSVAKPFGDLNTNGKAVETWVKANCSKS